MAERSFPNIKKSHSRHVNVPLQSAFYHEMKMHCHEQVIIFLFCQTQDTQVLILQWKWCVSANVGTRAQGR